MTGTSFCTDQASQTYQRVSEAKGIVFIGLVSMRDCLKLVTHRSTAEKVPLFPAGVRCIRYKSTWIVSIAVTLSLEPRRTIA